MVEPGLRDSSREHRDVARTPAYQEALKALGEGVVRDVRIVEGVE